MACLFFQYFFCCSVKVDHFSVHLTCFLLGGAVKNCLVGITHSPVSVVISILGGTVLKPFLCLTVFTVGDVELWGWPGTRNDSDSCLGVGLAFANKMGIVGALTQATMLSIPRCSLLECLLWWRPGKESRILLSALVCWCLWSHEIFFLSQPPLTDFFDDLSFFKIFIQDLLAHSSAHCMAFMSLVWSINSVSAPAMQTKL